MRWTAFYRIGSVYCLVLLSASAVPANDYVPPSSNPEGIHAFNGYAYFSADDGIHGRELWRTDAKGNAELVKDLTKGPEGSRIGNYRQFGEILYFTAGSESSTTFDLWRTDGSLPFGTERVLEVDAKEGVSDIFAASERYLYFRRAKPGGGETAWRMDAQTVAERFPLDIGARPGTAANGIFLFGANDVDGEALWSIDETSGSTTRLLSTQASVIGIFSFNGGGFLVNLSNKDIGYELWITHGTPESTHLLKDIYPGPESSFPGQFAQLATVGGKPRVIFSANHPDTGVELWETDGTTEGTKPFADLLPGPGSSNPYSLQAHQRYLYFIAIGDTSGRELWGYQDGQGQPRLIADLNPGPASSEPYSLRLSSTGQVFFSALTVEYGEELWACETPLSAPVLVADIQAGPASSYPYFVVALDDSMVFAATDPFKGREIWIANGRTRAIEFSADIYTDHSVNPSSFPQQLTPAGDLLFFAANDIAHGNELWCTDGTSDGTRLVRDIFPGEASSNPESVTAVGTLVYFVADNGVHGSELWRSDGTSEGTSLMLDIRNGDAAAIQNLTKLGDKLLFSAHDGTNGEELWIVEPGMRPHLLADILGGPGSSMPREFVVWNEHVYFRANDGVHGEELWRTDGTKAGTVMIRDIITTPFESTAFGDVSIVNGALYFAANVNGSGMELWRVAEDGGALTLLQDIAGPETMGVLNEEPQE